MRYSESHEWVDDTGKVGISHFAQNELGDIVYVELPPVGKKIQAGGELAVLESTKAAADVYSPVSGTVTEVNMALKEHPELINSAAEKEGWICQIQISSSGELVDLMDRETYEKRVSGK